MGDEDAVEALEAHAGLEDLALGAFAAIDQEAVLVVLNQVGGQVALGGGGGGGGAEEGDLKQGRGFLSSVPLLYLIETVELRIEN